MKQKKILSELNKNTHYRPQSIDCLYNKKDTYAS